MDQNRLFQSSNFSIKEEKEDEEEEKNHSVNEMGTTSFPMRLVLMLITLVVNQLMEASM